MRFNKKLALLCIFMALILVLTACGEKIAEKAVEKAVEGETGENVDINLDEGGVTIEGEGGSFQVGEGVEWPKDKMGDLPVPEAKIIGVMSDDASGGCVVTFEEMSQKDAEEYIKALEDLGYTEDAFKMQDAESQAHTARRAADGGKVSFIFSNSTEGIGGGTINYSKSK